MPHRGQRVFVDTSAFVALMARRDRHNDEAVRIAAALAKGRAALCTTNFVVAEAHAFILSDLGAEAGRAFLRAMGAPGAMRVVRVEPGDEARATDIVLRYIDKDFTLVDAISFAVMERLGITHAFAFDRYFRQYGWPEVTA